eukprot:1159158-Pelagomonas_calceolata.AAC.2
MPKQQVKCTKPAAAAVVHARDEVACKTGHTPVAAVAVHARDEVGVAGPRAAHLAVLVLSILRKVIIRGSALCQGAIALGQAGSRSMQGPQVLMKGRRLWGIQHRTAQAFANMYEA